VLTEDHGAGAWPSAVPFLMRQVLNDHCRALRCWRLYRGMRLDLHNEQRGGIHQQAALAVMYSESAFLTASLVCPPAS